MNIERTNSAVTLFVIIITIDKTEEIKERIFDVIINTNVSPSRDILCYAMRTLSHCFIVGHVHDELIIETPMDASLDTICEQMGRTPDWIEGLCLRADGYETPFYKKD